MTTKTKLFAALTALTVAATLALPASEAQAKPKWGLGVGLVGAGIVAGSIAAAHAGPVYVVGPRCRLVDRFDRWGNYYGTVKVCQY